MGVDLEAVNSNTPVAAFSLPLAGEKSGSGPECKASAGESRRRKQYLLTLPIAFSQLMIDLDQLYTCLSDHFI